MATTYPVLFVDGPCANEVRQLTAQQIKNGRAWCQGQLYVNVSYLGGTDYKYVFQLQTAVAKQRSGTDPTHVTQAWSRWMRTLAHKGPAAHRRTLAVASRARRIARNR